MYIILTLTTYNDIVLKTQLHTNGETQPLDFAEEVIETVDLFRDLYIRCLDLHLDSDPNSLRSFIPSDNLSDLLMDWFMDNNL
jgi:hypothetical protein